MAHLEVSEEQPREAVRMERLGSGVGQVTVGGERKASRMPPAHTAGQLGQSLQEEGTGNPQRPGRGPGGPHSWPSRTFTLPRRYLAGEGMEAGPMRSPEDHSRTLGLQGPGQAHPTWRPVE